MNTLEKEIERYLVNRVKQFGGKALKMVPEFESGVPDRLVVLNGQTVFVELKAPGKQPRKLQVLFMQELEKAGAKTVVLDSREGVEQLISNILKPQ